MNHLDNIHPWFWFKPVPVLWTTMDSPAFFLFLLLFYLFAFFPLILAVHIIIMVFQERLIKKLGANAYPFFFELPPHCPASVTLQPAPGDTGPTSNHLYISILFLFSVIKCFVIIEITSILRRTRIQHNYDLILDFFLTFNWCMVVTRRRYFIGTKHGNSKTWIILKLDMIFRRFWAIFCSLQIRIQSRGQKVSDVSVSQHSCLSLFFV